MKKKCAIPRLWRHFGDWGSVSRQALGHLEPEYDNDRSRKTFEIRLPLAKDQVTPQVTEQVGKLLWQFGNKPVDGKSLMDTVGISHRPTFLYSYLQPALNAGLVEMTIPDKPRSSKQKNRLTDKGKEWVEQNQAEKAGGKRRLGGFCNGK